METLTPPSRDHGPATEKTLAPSGSQDGNPILENGSLVHVPEWDAEEEKTLIKKIDWHVLPMLCVVFGLSLLDRSNISSAYIAGMSKHLNLAIGSRYSIALLVFFPCYALFEIPSNLIIRYIGAKIWLSSLIVLWGVMVLVMGFVQNWKILVVLRALLGVFEAGLFPGAIYIISSWYKTYETSKRISIFYMAALLATGWGGILAYAFSLIKAGNGIFTQGWRWIFIIEGAATIVCGVVAFFALGDFPEQARWLTDRQRTIAKARITLDRGDGEYIQATFKQSLSFLRDWKLGVYSIQYFICASSVYSLAYFLPVILKDGLGFDYKLSLILTSPPYLFTIICTIATASLSDKYQTRWPFLCGQAIIAIVGLLVVLYAHAPGVRLFGIFLAVWGTQSNIPGTLTYGQNQTVRQEKRAVVAAAMITMGAAGGVTGSTIFRSQDAPLYMPGMWATISLQILYLFGTFAMSMYLRKQNKGIDEGRIPFVDGVKEFRYAP